MTIGIDSSQSECSENVGIAESNQADGRSEQDESPVVLEFKGVKMTFERERVASPVLSNQELKQKYPEAVSFSQAKRWQAMGKPPRICAPVTDSRSTVTDGALSAAARRELVEKPFPPIGLIVTHGAHSRGGVEVGSDEELFMRKARGSRKPSLSDYEGG